jgi:bacterioferritin (cytochrome b1)
MQLRCKINKIKKKTQRKMKESLQWLQTGINRILGFPNFQAQDERKISQKSKFRGS